MTQKRPDPFAPVRAVIQSLAPLTHDEHRDLADMLTADLATEPTDHLPARHGLPPVNPEDGHSLILDGGWQYRDESPLFTAPARDELQQAYERADDLPPEAKRLIIQVARLLQNALAPVAGRKHDTDGQPVAQGNIQTKTIRRKVLNLDTGEIEIKPFGPYLYFRYLVSGGDADRRGKRLKNKYIGRQALAQVFDRTAPGSPERRDLERRIIAAMHAGTLDTLMMEMGLQPAPVSADTLGLSEDIPNPQQTADDSTPAEPPNAGVSAPFLPDYVTAPTRKQTPLHFELTEERRDVLATIAAGLSYSADYREGIHKRKVARALTDAGLLTEVTKLPNHQRHAWRLTDAGLKLIRSDEDLQRRVASRLTD